MQTQLLIRALQILQLALRQEIEDCAGVLVLIVNDVAGRRGNGISGVASLCRHVVAHLCNRSAVLAATVRRLHLHCIQLLHERRLLVAAGKLRLRKAACNRLRHTGKAVEHPGIHGVEAVANAAVHSVKLPLDVREIRGQHIAIRHAAAVAKAVASPAEQEKDDDPNPVLPPHSHASAVVVCGLYRHGRYKAAAVRKCHKKYAPLF